MWLHHVIMMGETLLNLLCNIIQVATISDASGLRILYSFMYILLFNPLALWSFYLGLTGLCWGEKDGNKKWYKIVAGLLTICYILISILHIVNFNGWVRVAQVMSDSAVSGVFCIIESIIMTGIAVLCGFSLFKFHTFNPHSGDPIKK